MKKRLLSLLLTAAMLLSLLPPTAIPSLAADDTCTHAYTSTVTPPTCTEQGYTTYTCACGDSYVDDYVDATGHTYENGTCLSCGKDDTTVELFDGFSATDFFLKDGVLSDGQEHIVAIYSNTNNARMAVIPIQEGATYYIRIKNNDQDSTKRMRICAFAEDFSSLVISPLASERNMAALDPNVVSVAQDVIFWDPNKGEGCVSEYEGVFVNTENAKTLVLFTAWGADPSLVSVSVKGENHIPESHPLDNMDEMIHILTENINQENQATRDILQIAQVFWEHRDEFIYCSGTALDQPWNYWSYTGYVDSANTGKTVTAENAGYKRIDCSTFVRYVINGIDYYSTPYFNALEHTQVEQGGLNAGLDVSSEDPTVCRTGKMYIRSGKKLILEAKNNNYAFTKVFGYNASGQVIQTLETTAANTVFVPDEDVVYLRAEMKVTSSSDYAPASAGVPAAILKCLRIREDERLEINADVPLSGYRNANQICKWFDENGYAVEFDRENFNPEDLQVGSVIFWGRASGTWAYKNITHTSLYIGDGYILHVSAPYGLLGGEGILIEPIEKLIARYDIPLAAISSPKYHTADGHTHSYASVVTPPTCVEQGYTTHTCACGDSYVDDYVDATGHNYGESFTCSQCGYEAKVSVLGDSISTYSGISDVKNAVYPNSTVKSVSDTWWQQVIDMLGGKLLKVNASGGSRILSDEYFNGNGIRNGNHAAYRERCINLHVGNDKPDIILVFMGTNDFSYHVESGCEKCQILLACAECSAREDGSLNVCASCRAASGVYSSFCNLPLGTADNVDISKELPSSSCEAYAIMLSKMNAAYPDAQIYCMGLLPRVNPYQSVSYHDHGQPTAFNAELKKVAENSGATFIDLEHCLDNSAATWSTYFGDAVHPTAKGMDKISETVVSSILGKEVYVVSSDLTDGVALSGDSLVIEGEAYEASIITTNSDLLLNVQITMNGEDITETVYNGETGKINIVNVTGNIVVAVKARVTEGEITWTVGTISTIDGSNADNYPNRIRTGFIAIDEGVIIRTVNNAQINVVFYDEHYKILPTGNNCGWTTEWSSTNAPVATVYIRVAAKDESGMALTVEYGKNITLIRGCIHIYENGICTSCGEADPDYRVPGDINGDGEVNNKDITRLFQYLSNYDVEVVEEALDVNNDGEVNNKDLTHLFQYLSNYDVTIH